MWRIPENVPAPDDKRKALSGVVDGRRRVEVTVERQVCTFEVHGNFMLQPGASCPVCGQILPENAAALELQTQPQPEASSAQPIRPRIAK